MKTVLVSLFSAWILYSLLVYFTCNEALKKSHPINYTIKENVVHTGRGSSYSLCVFYQQKEYKVDITAQSSARVNKNQYPTLFYNSSLDIVFEKWKLKQSTRIIGVCLLMIIMVLFLIRSNKKSP